MKRCIAILFSLCALTAVCAQSGTTTYNLTLTGTRTMMSVPIRVVHYVCTVEHKQAEWTLRRSHTLYLVCAHACARGMPMHMHARSLGPAVQSVMADAHLLELIDVGSCGNCSHHLLQAARSSLPFPTLVLAKPSFWSVSTSSMNGSVAIPLFQAQFDPIPGSTTSGLIAAATVTPAMFVGPLEVLPDFTNVDVPTVLSEYVQQGRAYAQVGLDLEFTLISCHTLHCSHQALS